MLLAQAAQDEAKNMEWWCSTTSHPQPCNHHMKQFHPKSHQDFRTMSVAAAMERAKTLARELSGSTSKKMVQRECEDLIDGTILHLNATLQSMMSSSTRANANAASDEQTWLSAALTNIETCIAGSHELSLPEFSSPILKGNVSEMIRNCLAVNAGLLGNSAADDPGWVTDGDRKLLQDYVWAARANVTVSKDGSGQFRSIQEAINYATANRLGKKRVIVYVKRGVYEENILINRTMNKVMLVGDGVRNTIITGNRSSSAGFTTYSTATFGVDGNGFIARGITFRNTAGAESGQAVALRSASDLSVFYGCSFEGYQDTLFTQAQRQLYKSCYIYGTVDIIFGNAAVVLQNCVIYARKPLVGQANVITAQGRGDPYQNTGISIHNCRILAAPDLKPVVDSFRTYLGRPWQEYSRTVVMKSYLDGLVDPEGWSKWGDSDFALDTLYYGEYQNFGPAASMENRVNWTGYHNITTPAEAAQFTVANLIFGRQWLPTTGVPFTVGL
ncbi:probable pectinesterase/pectinesterase inhibitor 59 isoform X2 [Salvia miltiorrhiza]|uniref:probable pectinesterase/pectinesterase inhibitor 59 isoform X2 n=1 Tax=Salvia miltiorrhiza TaxID=226208 RepID=UPI0025AD96F7|nr:probable pectinesterase/pectinesterase inhibitor 59 isoform X2 [Salvia miltiorrhiza]